MPTPNSTVSMQLVDSFSSSCCGTQQNSNTSYDVSSFEVLPPGYRFKPTDEEIINHYLKKVVNNQPLPGNMIIFEDVYKMKPDDLLEKYKLVWPEDEAYFFTPRERKYPNGFRPNRQGLGGHWKASGADKRIRCGETVGLKKNLVYYIGKASMGDKTDWLMQEYRLEGTDIAPHTEGNKDIMRLNDFVLCKIYKKTKGAKQDNGDGESLPSSNASINNNSANSPSRAPTNFHSYAPVPPPPSNFNTTFQQIQPFQQLSHHGLIEEPNNGAGFGTQAPSSAVSINNKSAHSLPRAPMNFNCHAPLPPPPSNFNNTSSQQIQPFQKLFHSGQIVEPNKGVGFGTQAPYPMKLHAGEDLHPLVSLPCENLFPYVSDPPPSLNLPPENLYPYVSDSAPSSYLPPENLYHNVTDSADLSSLYAVADSYLELPRDQFPPLEDTDRQDSELGFEEPPQVTY